MLATLPRSGSTTQYRHIDGHLQADPKFSEIVSAAYTGFNRAVLEATEAPA
jgi:hypothetical protein